MRSIKFSLCEKTPTGWDAAVRLTEAYLGSDRKADQLLEELPPEFGGDRRAACQSLFLGALRHGHRTRAACAGLMRKRPKAGTEAILLVAGYELWAEAAERHPKIIHHAVERSKARLKPQEWGFLNAVLRQLGAALHFDPATRPAAHFSHPEWLVAHWQRTFPENYADLLAWNQAIPRTYLRSYAPAPRDHPDLEASRWPGFFKLRPGADWQGAIAPLLNRGDAYLKDPSTRLAPELLDPQPGEAVLDLCAAPGGKAFDLAHHMEGRGRLVAVDLPSSRLDRLQANLDSLRMPELERKVMPGDVLELNAERFEDAGLPPRYDAVMLDAPCSNTGVIQRRTDVKWRLEEGAIAAAAKLQQQLLHSAARFVRPGGRLVYSTCSIEPEENQSLVEGFLASRSGACFELSEARISLPWESGHDGAAAFRLERRRDERG